MNHGILTNKFTAEYNYDNIDRDFDIYMITKISGKLDKTNILDIPAAEWKALSVQYTFGRNAFVLFRKGSVDEFDFRNSFQGYDSEITIKKVDVLDETFRNDNFYYNDRLLAQLLLNTLKSPQKEKYSYNNLTGKLYYSDGSWIHKNRTSKETNMLYALEVFISPGMYITLRVNTFKVTNGFVPKGKKLFVIDSKTKQLRRKLKSDEKNDKIFIQESYDSKHNTVDYLDISSIQKFHKCKLGVMHRLLTDVKEKLRDYISLVPGYVNDANRFDLTESKKNSLTKDKIRDMLICPINLIDDVKDGNSSNIIKVIESKLKDFFDIDVAGYDLSKSAYNIRLIHEENYYENNGIHDIHDDVPERTVVQHITLEKNGFELAKDKGKSALNKILQELLIKADVQRKKITVYDWRKLGFSDVTGYVIREKIKTEFDAERKPHINRAGESVFDNYRYLLLEISSDGVMHFIEFNDNQSEDKKLEAILTSFEIYNKMAKKDGNTVEGLVYSSINNIHAIIRTQMNTMPDIDAVWTGLDETNPKTLLDTAILMNAADVFRTYNPEFKAYADLLIKRLEQEEKSIERNSFRKIMDYKHFPKAASDFNRYLHSNYGIRIFSEIKSKDFDDDYQLENILDIKYYTETDYLGNKAFMYFAGTKRAQLQSSVHNACIVRKVLADGKEIEFEKFLPLLAVDFVRNNQHTVLPFPFKYLREYSEMA